MTRVPDNPAYAQWERIAPNSAPGGLVFRLTAAGRVFAEHRIAEADGIGGVGGLAEGDAILASALAERYGEARSFIYDGDTGECVGTLITTHDDAPPFNPDPDLDASIRVPPRRRHESR